VRTRLPVRTGGTGPEGRGGENEREKKERGGGRETEKCQKAKKRKKKRQRSDRSLSPRHAPCHCITLTHVDISLGCLLDTVLPPRPSFLLSLQPDYVAASVHKWLCSPYGAALVYVTSGHTSSHTISGSLWRAGAAAIYRPTRHAGARDKNLPPFKSLRGLSR